MGNFTEERRINQRWGRSDEEIADMTGLAIEQIQLLRKEVNT